MADNNNTTPGDGGDGGGGGGNNNLSPTDITNLVLAICALFISIVALIIAVLQALQQYFASATGYSSCSPQVIGQWAKFTSRRMKWDQFRFEVQFEVPVIFVAKETNTRGPLGSNDEKRIVYLNGSAQSYQDSNTWSQDEFDRVQKDKRGSDTRQTIHTSDNEMATWVALLMAIQRMEKESRDWQDKNFFNYEAPTAVTTPHTLTVGIQQKRRSWDTMPDSLKKPYAITTIAHLVEMAAMLGIYWREFDRSENVYRAQGNGFVIEGSNVDDIGLVFTLQKVSPTWFQENRVVPNEACKELCFGLCPTIFRDTNVKSAQYADEPKGVETLQLGSLSEIGETLAVLGCNNNTVNYFRAGATNTRYSHLFPVPFEMLGLIGVVIQIENTAFSMLPNPTVFHWDRSSFSLRRLLNAYTAALSEGQLRDALLKPNDRLAAIQAAAGDLEENFIHLSAAKKADGKPLGLTLKPPRKSMGEKPDQPELMSLLHKALRECDAYLRADEERMVLVLHVVRAHLQEVLKVLNRTPTPDESQESQQQQQQQQQKPTAAAAAAAAADEHSTDAARTKENTVTADAGPLPPTLEELDAASSGARHGLFVDLYVSWVRQRVIRRVRNERLAERLHARRGTMIGGARPELPSPIKEAARGNDKANEVAVEDPLSGPDPEEQAINDIWCTLIFRMICWLLLHDFHKKDIQISKSEVFGSRLSVYIM